MPSKEDILKSFQEGTEKAPETPNNDILKSFNAGVNTESISGLESGARGALSGFGTSAINIPLAGLQTGVSALQGKVPLSSKDLLAKYNALLEENKQREEASRQQKPLEYYGGMLAGGMASPLGALAEGAELAQGASAVQKIGSAALTGAKIGGMYGAGEAAVNASPIKGNAAEELGKAAKTTVGGALGGTILGGTLGAVGQGISKAASGAVNSLAESEVPVLSNLAKNYKLGLEGINLLDSQKLLQTGIDEATIAGTEGIAEPLKDLNSAIGQEITGATKEGRAVDLSPVLNSLDEAEAKAQELSGDEKDKLMNFIEEVRNRISGAPESKVVHGLESEGVQTLEKSTPAAIDEMQAKVDALNAKEISNSKLTNEPPKTYEIIHDVQNNAPVIGIKATSPATALEGAKITPPSEYIANTPGTPEVQATKLRPTIDQVVQRPDVEPISTPQEADTMYKELRQKAVGTFQPSDTVAKPAAKEIVTGIQDQLDNVLGGGETGEGFADLRAKRKAVYDAMDVMGIKANTPGEFFIKDPTQLTPNGEAKEILNPDVTEKIFNLAQKALENPTDATRLRVGLGHLKDAGFEGVDEMFSNLQKAITTQKQAGYTPSLNTLVSPYQGAVAKVIKIGPIASNMAGLATNKVANAIPSAEAAANFLAKTPAPGKIGDPFLARAAGLFSKEDQNKSSPTENFSRNLSSATTEQLTPIINTLKSGGNNLNYYGTALEKAIADNNTIQKNSIIFAISQNPEARKLLLQTGNK